MNSQLKIIFFGTPDFVIPVAKTLKQNFDLVGVVTAPDAIQGRKKILTPSPIKSFATEHGIPVFTSEQFDDSTCKELEQIKPDIFVVAAYGVIIPQRVLDLPRLGSINIHPSLLPKYRGPSPIQTALLNGDQISGVTIIKMDADVDHGPILTQWEIDLKPDDTFAKLHVLMFEDAARRLPQTISDYAEGKLALLPQEDNLATFCTKITKESGYFTSDNPPSPEVLDRMIRAYYPWPNAWTKLQMSNGKWQIVKLLPDKKIQFEGGKPMFIKDAINGYPKLQNFITGLFNKEK